MVDVRSILCFWRLKPVAMDTGGHAVAVMRQSIFHGDVAHKHDKSVRRWGNPYSALDLWIDLDRGIKNGLLVRDYITVKIYLDAMIEINGYDWERWKALPYEITKQLQEVCYNLIREGENDVHERSKDC